MPIFWMVDPSIKGEPNQRITCRNVEDFFHDAIVYGLPGLHLVLYTDILDFGHPGRSFLDIYRRVGLGILERIQSRNSAQNMFTDMD